MTGADRGRTGVPGGTNLEILEGFSLVTFKRTFASKLKKMIKRSTVVEERSSLYRKIYTCRGS